MRLSRTDEGVTQLGVEASRLKIFPPGTVLLAMYGSIGAVSIADIDTTTNQAILGIKCGPLIDPEYLWCFLRTVQPSLAALGRGGTQANINATMVRDLKVPVPPVDEQRRIAARLTEQLAVAARAKVAAQGRLQDLSRLREAIVDQIVGMLVAGHGTTPLRGFIDETRNGLYKPDSYYGSGTPILKMFNIGTLGQWKLDRVDRLRLSDSESAAYALSDGDLLINRVNSRELVGKVAVVGDETAGMVFESKNIRLRLDHSRLDPWFAAPVLRSAFCRRQILASAKQIVGMATISRSSLDSLRLPVPRLADQQRIAAELGERLTSINETAKISQAEVDAIGALPAALLRRAFGDLPNSESE